MRTHRTGPVAAFLALTFGASWTIEIVSAFLPGPLPMRLVLSGALAMLCPAVAAFLVRGPLYQEGFCDAGLRLNLRSAWRVYLAAYLSVPLLIAA